jgi:hypothetical protein
MKKFFLNLLGWIGRYLIRFAREANDPVWLHINPRSFIHMKTTEKTVLSFFPLRADGTPVKNPSYVSGQQIDWAGGAGVVSLFPVGDGMTCECSGVAAGEIDVQATAQMNTTAGPKAIVGLVHISITQVVVVDTSDDPVALQVLIGTIVPQ